MASKFNQWFDGLSDEEQARVKRNLTREPPEQPEEPVSAMERLRRGHQRDPDEVRRERRGQGDA